MSIWEMRNPVILERFLRALVAFNFNQEATAQLKDARPLDVNRLSQDFDIQSIAPSVKAKLPSIRAKFHATSPHDW